MDQGPIVVDRYELHGAIASGGMATVYLGRMRGAVGFARTVAIKRLHPQLASDPDFVSMFLDEARLVSRVRHPNVIPTIDVVTVGSELLIVMEYAHGESLGKLMARSRKRGEVIPPSLVATVMTGALHGLHAAHEATSELGRPLGIVHRDVTPQNVLVGADGESRLLDFGVAKAAGQVHTTRDGHLKGKAAYMPPEQVRGRGVDRRTDVYAAGVLLWEALAGRRLFDADNDVAIIAQVLDQEVPAPSRVVASVPPALDAVVMRALARDPDRRFPTARDFALALESAVPLASQREVAEWVQRVAADGLARRAAAIATMERAGERGSTPHLASLSLITPASGVALAPDGLAPIASHPASEVPASGSRSQVISVTSTAPGAMPQPPRRIGLLLAGAVLLLGSSAAVVALLHGRTTTTATEQAAPVASGSPAVATASTPVEVPPPAALPSAPESAVAAAPPSASSAPLLRPPPAAAPSAPRPPVAAKPSCNPPYTTDASGIMHLKPQCL